MTKPLDFEIQFLPDDFPIPVGDVAEAWAMDCPVMSRWQFGWIGPLAPIGSLLFAPEKPKGKPAPTGILTVHEGRVGGVPMCSE